jgi:hypothetical protein
MAEPFHGEGESFLRPPPGGEVEEVDPVVEVEVAAEGRHPVEPPAHALLELLDLGQGRAGHRQEAHVTLREMPVGSVDVVGQEGAAGAALLIF